METRLKTWTLAGGLATAAVAWLAVVEQRKHDVPAAPQAARRETPRVEPELPTPEQRVLALASLLEKENALGRRAALAAMEEALEEGGTKRLDSESRELAAGALIRLYRASAEDDDGLQDRRDALRLAVGRVGGAQARAFAVETLTSATDTLKLEALRALLLPGAVRGKAVAEKALELAGTPLVPDTLRPALLRRVLGRKAEDELLALLDGESTAPALAACAVEIQNLGKPELMGGVLRRLDEGGLLEDPRKLPWMSGRLLSEHILKSEDGPELSRALRVVRLRPSLVRATAKAVQSRAAHKDASIRREVVRLIPEAVKSEGLDEAAGEQLLAARLEAETDPLVKEAIQGSLAAVRGTQAATQIERR